MATGLPMPPGFSAPPAVPMAPASFGTVSNGTMSGQSLAGIKAMELANEAAAQAQQALPVMGALAAHIRTFMSLAEAAKLDVERAMLDAMYARRGEYPPEKAAKIVADGQPLIFMMLPSVKMRQAESLLRDAVVGAGTFKPWTLQPPKDPELPPFEVNQIRAAAVSEVEQALNMGLEPTLEDIRERLNAAKVQLSERLREEASVRCKRMEDKMEDQLQTGEFDIALDEFISDLTTFKAAFIAGPLVRRKPRLTWGPDNQPVVTLDNVMEWERVSPFDMYPAPWAKTISDGPLIRKHKLTRKALTEMIGVEGYSTPMIRKVLELFGAAGLTESNTIDSQLARAEGKIIYTVANSSGLIDALQYFGSVSGSMLRGWGMTEAQVPDVAKEYQIEAWCVSNFVIKAVLNADPLARRPFYATSYERVPGTIWGNSVYDLMRDCSDVCNGSARALVANLAIASGPQVVVQTDRLAQGTVVSSMHPWMIWQMVADPMGSVAKPIDFFQPQSNAAELMTVFAKFSDMADEYTGIPKYTVGAEAAGGAGRTASGMSMMLGNASKIIKAVVSNVDINIFTPLLERLYYFNMRYSDDPDLKGAANVVAHGALSLQQKEAAQAARQQFLAATNNPTDLQITGLEGRAEVLRATLDTLDMNTSKVVPPVAIIKDRQKILQMQQAQAALAGQAPEVQGAPSAPPTQVNGNGGSGQALMGPGGAPGPQTTDNFQPAAQPA